MSLFSGKKKSGDNLRTLSEKEIQDKLYGSFRSASGAVRDNDLPSGRESAQSTATLSKPSPVLDLYKEIKESAKPAPPVHVEKPSAERPAERVRPWQQPVKPSTDNKPAAVTAKPRPAGAGFSKHFAKISKAAAAGVVAFFREAITLFLQLILAMDLRKPKVRLAVYWGMGGLFLVVLLAGIHFLNMQRETAMKRPRRPAVVQPAETTVEAPAAKSRKRTQDKEEAPLSASETREARETAPAAAQEFNHIGSHVIQIATFAAEADARKLADRLKEDALPSFVKPLTRSSGKVYYCVFMGRYPDAPTAEKKLEEFRKKEVSKSFQDAFVRTI